MAYIETHQSLLTHRKTLRLARLLKMDRFAVTGRLMALWCWALDNAQEGRIPVQDSDILADVMGWDGEPGELCDALVAAGFLDKNNNAYFIHDWWDYAGKLIEKRKSDAERKRQIRAQSGQTPPVQRTSNGHPTDGAGNVPNRSVPYPSTPPSKSESVHPTGDGGSEGTAQPPNEPSAPAPVGASAPAASAACDDATFTHLCAEVAQAAHLTTAAPEKIAHLLKQHPTLAHARLIFEAEMAAEWIADPSRNRKKRTMSVSFLNNWLSKASEPPHLRVVNGHNGNTGGGANGHSPMPRASPAEPERVFRDARTLTIRPRPASLDNLPPPPPPKHTQNRA